MYFHIRGEADAISPMVVFAVSGSCCALRFSRHGGSAEAAAFPESRMAHNLRVRRFDGWAPVRTGAEKRLFQPRRPAWNGRIDV